MKIGVAIDIIQESASGDVPTYAQMREQARAVEAAGFDSIWLFDHLLIQREPETTLGIWECWTLLSALAETTNRVELGTLVLANPFRNPALLAKMAHTLDEVSGGRVILGVGAGWHKPEFDAFGFSFERRVDRFEEALQIMTPLLRGETVNFSGAHYRLQDCSMTPAGPRAKIPILVGAKGPRMLRLVARYADQWNTAWLGDPQELAERLAWIREACADIGRDPATLAVTVAVQVAFSDLGQFRAMAKEPLSGSAEDLARAFQGYEQAGAAHLILKIDPAGQVALQRVADALRLYRN